MKLTEECLRVNAEIKKINEKIADLKGRAAAPKNQILTGMPRGGNSIDTALDRYLIRCEALEKDKSKLQDELKGLWEQLKAVLTSKSITDDAIKLFQYRYYNGLSWRKCASANKWKESKCFRVHRAVLYIIDKKE